MKRTSILGRSLSRSLVLAALAALPQLADAQVVTNWVAYNDFGPGTGTAPNVSTYDMGFGPGGPLTNLPANQFPVAELPPGYPLGGQARLVVRPENATGVFGLPAAGGYPYSGTPAYNYFNGITDFGASGSMFGVGAGQAVRLTFTNLNPAMHYKFRGTAVRNGASIGTHDLRWTLCSIEGALSFVSAHTPDAAPTNGMSIVTPNTPASDVPGLTLTNGQAAFQSGVNTNGMVVGWDDIVPAADGTFTVVNQSYNGPMRDLGGALTNATPNIGYVLADIVLVEYGTPTSLSWVTQPVATLTVTQLLSIRLSASASGSAPYYQWYKQGVGAIAGANSPDFVFPNASIADSGTYYCVVTNRTGSIQSTSADVTVVADTFKPEVAKIVGSGSFTTLTIQFSERINLGQAADDFNYDIVGQTGVGPVVVTNAGTDLSGTVVVLTTPALAENTTYQLKVKNITDLSGNVVDDTRTYSFTTWLTSPAGGVKFEAYSPVGSPNTIDSLTNPAVSPNFPNNPFTNGFMGVFDSRAIFSDDSHEGYGSRTRGLFIPPISGLWRFYVRSDDPAQVFLNPDGPSPSGKILILNETGCCGNWNKYESPAVELAAGQGYYIEALHKEGTGGDYVKVAARLDGTGKPTPNDTANSAIDPAAIAGDAIGYPAAPPGIAGNVGFTLEPTNTPALENQIITFTAATTNTYGLPTAYQWRRAGADIPGANSASYTLVATPGDDNVQFSVQAAILGAKIVSTAAVLTVTPDNVRPTVVSTSGDQTFTNVIIRFSELMSQTSVESQFGYSFTGPNTPTVLAAVLQPDGMTVVLSLSEPLQADTDYTIGMTDATDLAGNLVVGPAQLHTWKPVSGYVTFQTYNTGAGNNVADLTSSPNYPNNPRETFYIRSFDSREAYPDSSHEQFGGRMYGFFTPPTDGNWIFYISSDDASELYLNPAGTAAIGKVLIAAEPGCCNPFSAHPSTPQALQAGQQYYIEALYKEGTGGDYLRVAVKLDTDPTNPDSLSPIPTSMLGTFLSPVGGSVSITQNPTDQTGVVSSPGKILLSQNFNADNGSFAVTNSPTPPAGPWVYNAAKGTWSANGGEGVNYSLLHSPTMTVTEAGPVVLSFYHRYNFEYDGNTRWDGGQVRLSVNGGPFNPVPATNFTVNGYKTDKVIGGNNILNNQYAFNDASAGWSGGTFIQSIATLGTFIPGDKLTLQFAGAWDEGTVNPPPNWEIDSIVVSEAVFPLYSEDFAGTNGSFAVVNSATPPAGPWVYNAGRGTWLTDGGEGVVYSLLNSPDITVSKDGYVNLTFYHRYFFEYDGTRWDGGQVRVSANGGTYAAVGPDAFTTNGYAPTPITGSGIIQGQYGFNSQSPDYTNSFTKSVASLGGFHVGDTISVQFLGSWDEGYRVPTNNWEIDKIVLEDGIAVPVTFSVMATGTLPGATVVPIAYQWQKDTGAGFQDIVGATSSNLTFFVTEADNGSLYRCIVSIPGTSVASTAALLTIGAGTPSLAVTRSAGTATISWPDTATGYVLDQSLTLSGTPPPWALVPVNTYTTNAGTISVTVPITSGNGFYRLRKQ